MKKYFLSLVFAALITSSIYAQTVFTSKEDVFAAKTIHFYGYDISHLKMVDGSRIGQDFTKFFPAFTRVMILRFAQKDYEIEFRKAKGCFPINPEPTQAENVKIHQGNFAVQEAPAKLSADTLAAMIKTYQLPETEGIGSVVIFECFNKEAKTTSIHMMFFDIATRTILYSKELVSRDGNQYKVMGDWKKASIIAMERMRTAFGREFAAYKKTQKLKEAEAEKAKSKEKE